MIYEIDIVVVNFLDKVLPVVMMVDVEIVVVLLVVVGVHLHTEKRPTRAQHIPLGQSASVSHCVYGTHFCSVVEVAIVVVILVPLHLQIGYGIIGFVTHSPPLQSASFEQNVLSSHVKSSFVVVAIVVVVILVVLHLQHFQSQLHGTHSPPLQ